MNKAYIVKFEDGSLMFFYGVFLEIVEWAATNYNKEVIEVKDWS